MNRTKALLKRILPARLRSLVKYNLLPIPKKEREIAHGLGLYILDRARDFSHSIGGQAEALSAIENLITHPKAEFFKNMNESHQYLQTIFSPDYEHNLYNYYLQQQYLILLTFLSYPFRSTSNLSLAPFMVCSKKLKKMRILDYGAGLAFGSIYLLQTNPESVDAITIVDLDLIHTKFVEFIISTCFPDKDLRVFKLCNTEEIPVLGERQFNFIWGKDIFEHIHQPESVLRAILERAEDTSICYFDFSNHGEKYLQHIHPELSYLEEILTEFSFTRTGYMYEAMSEFTRGLV
jgi:SAM-dependent methyltransferase